MSLFRTDKSCLYNFKTEASVMVNNVKIAIGVSLYADRV